MCRTMNPDEIPSTLLNEDHVSSMIIAVDAFEDDKEGLQMLVYEQGVYRARILWPRDNIHDPRVMFDKLPVSDRLIGVINALMRSK